MSVEFFRQQRVHSSVFFNGSKGDDTFYISVPQNQVLLEIKLNILKINGRSGATLTKSLPKNFTGTDTITVHWYYDWFSAVTYEIIAVSGCFFQAIGLIKQKWEQLGAENGFLGCPLINETPTGDTIGRYNDFTGGSIYWNSRNGAFEVHGMIRAKWENLGSEMGRLGYPVTDETATPDRIGRYNHFESGSIYWHPNTGAFMTTGKIREKWSLYGWERGFLGYPIEDPITSVSGQVISQKFQGGEIIHNKITGFVNIKRKASVTYPLYEIEIHAVRAIDDNGLRETIISNLEIQKWVNGANMIFEVAGIKFINNGSMEVINDTYVNSVTGIEYIQWDYVKQKLNQIANREKKIVVLFRYGPDINPTGGGFSWWDYDFVVMPKYGTNDRCLGQENIGSLAHELGHYFGCPHTFGREFRTVEEALNLYQSSYGNITIFDGDNSVIDDTAPDPYIDELQCNFSQNAIVFGGQPIMIERDNIMSYYHCEFEHKTFSWGQTKRIRSILLERKNRGLIVVEITQ